MSRPGLWTRHPTRDGKAADLFYKCPDVAGTTAGVKNRTIEPCNSAELVYSSSCPSTRVTNMNVLSRETQQAKAGDCEGAHFMITFQGDVTHDR